VVPVAVFAMLLCNVAPGVAVLFVLVGKTGLLTPKSCRIRVQFVDWSCWCSCS